MSITFILEWHVRLDAVDEIKRLVASRLPETRAFEGCESVELLQDADDPTRLLFVERWASRDDQARYREFRLSQGTMAQFDELVLDRTRRFLEHTGI
ncbi:MAG: antibiotic biosynthesis monooxygenase [Actinobacteria bacterium]|nr:antibiotic biosynthesis monooxygenase [Actinomycetota bacterium]